MTTDRPTPCKDFDEAMWKLFCDKYPTYAYRHDQDKFWEYFQTKAPGISRQEMVELIEECEKTDGEETS